MIVYTFPQSACSAAALLGNLCMRSATRLRIPELNKTAALYMFLAAGNAQPPCKLCFEKRFPTVRCQFWCKGLVTSTGKLVWIRAEVRSC